jgi:hypothetical protein
VVGLVLFVYIRELIRKMSRANPLLGAPQIHGELLKLGIQISQATVEKYMVRQRKPPSQNWHTFLDKLVATDFLVVTTVSFRLLFVFVVLAHHRRRRWYPIVEVPERRAWNPPASSQCTSSFWRLLFTICAHVPYTRSIVYMRYILHLTYIRN